MRQIRERITQLLEQHGMERDKAAQIVDGAIQGTAALPLCDRTVRQLHDLEELFAELKERDIKVQKSINTKRKSIDSDSHLHC